MQVLLSVAFVYPAVVKEASLLPWAPDWVTRYAPGMSTEREAGLGGVRVYCRLVIFVKVKWTP